MRAAVAMAALIDHEGAAIFGPGGDVDLVRAKVIDHLGTVDGRVQAALGHGAHIHRADARRGGMQDQQFRVGVLGQPHRVGQHRLAIGLADGTLTDDHQRRLVAGFLADFLGAEAFQRLAVIADMHIVIGQVDRLTDQPDRGAAQPGLADAGVQHRRLVARVGADQLDHLRVVDILDPGGADIGRAVADRQARAIDAAFDLAAQPLDQVLQAEGGLDRNQIADQAGNLLALHGAGGGFQRLGPACRAQAAVFADIGLVEALAAQAVPDEAGLVVDPLFVHGVVVARQDAHDLAALGVDADVRPQRIHHVDGFGLGQFPRAGGEGIGLRDQRAHRAQVDDIALQVRVQRLVQIAGDLAVLAAAGLAHLGDARDLGGEAHAAGAGNAARHVGFDQRPQIQVGAGALGFAIAAEIDAVSHGLILQVALAALIADRAIQRVVDQQELHHALAGLADHGAVGADLGRGAVRAGTQVLDLHRAGGGGFRRPADHLDQAHAAVAGDGQAFVIAKARNLDPGLLAGLDQGQVRIDLDHLVVDLDLAKICHHVTFILLSGGPS